MYPYLYHPDKVAWVSVNGNVQAGTPVTPGNGLGINLEVTPVPVYHGSFAFEPVIFVVSFDGGNSTPNSRRKLVLCWDFLHLVTRHPAPSGVAPDPPDSRVPHSYVPRSNTTGPGSWGYPTDEHPHPEDAPARNDLYAGVDTRARDVGNDVLLREHQVLSEPDELFLAGNTVTPSRRRVTPRLRLGWR
jgi:hypothetical protein